MTAMKHIDVNVNEYLAAHGRRPRGTGLWLIRYQDGVVSEVTGSYSEVVTVAKRYASEHGMSRITVLP